MTRRALLAGLSALALGAACSVPPGPEFQAAVPIDLPQPEAVDAVVFLIGDAGAASDDSSPTLRRLQADVEYWSENLEADSAVTVVFLGDNVYPLGIRDRTHPEFPRDSARLWSQIEVLDGPFARERGAAGIFLAGNHDWGNMTGVRGTRRLENQAALLDSARAREGYPVWLMPEPGDAGPTVRDVRHNVRLLLIDTHWFLQEGESDRRTRFLAGIEQAMVEAEERHIIFAAHHPYQSAGPHGVLAPGARVLGLYQLMKNSGTLVQDLNSPIYRDLLRGMRRTFRRVGHAPLVFAGGHDHSLQVLDSPTSDGPSTVLVSGAGSKLTDLAVSPLLRYAATKPGYMTLVFRSNEAVDLFVLAGETLKCPPAEENDGTSCVEEEAADVSLVYSERLAPAASLPVPDTLAAPDTSAAAEDSAAAGPGRVEPDSSEGGLFRLRGSGGG